MVFKLFQSTACVFIILSFIIYILIILTILNNIVKNRVYKTSFFRYSYDDLYHSFQLYIFSHKKK